MADIVIINPRFDVSYWGMEHALPFLGKRANVPVAALPLLAALTPEEHTVTLMDENVEAIDYKRLEKADIVAVTGMVVQRVRMTEILTELKERQLFTVVGGPWVTVREDYFGDLADVIFVGEAEVTWPQFLNEWKEGKHKTRYEQLEKTDMTTVPTPRFDKLKMEHYMFGSIQFSRGCPFQCEFCDIIITFGRRPRLKTSKQIVAELEALRAQNVVTAFIVDDNLIGNKKEVKGLLRDLVEYQKSVGYHFDFVTEASLDLAEDAELMELMVDANISSVFIGIESPNEKSLKETKKLQNIRPVGTIIERVHRVQKAGIEVWCGMILGFDNDDPTIFEAQKEFIKETRVVSAMIGMLVAVPKTPLYDRLLKEGRLDLSDDSEFGTNVIPVQFSREELRDGYIQTTSHLYDPEVYFDRLDDLYITHKLDVTRGITKYWKKHPLRWLWTQVLTMVVCFVLYFRIMRLVPEKKLRKVYRERIWRFVKSRPNAYMVEMYLLKCILHYHQYTIARQMASGRSAIVNTF